MESLDEELLAVEAIYPECIVREPYSPRRITIYPQGSTTSTSISLSIPKNYPNSIPSILGTIGINYSSVQDLLTESWTPGDVCLYVLIDKLRERKEDANIIQSRRSPSISSSIESSGESYEFAISDPIVDRKSTFVGRALAVHSRDEVRNALDWLKMHDRKVAKATHNIVAWRIMEHGVLMKGRIAFIWANLDNDDDGEDAAGGRITHLLEIMVPSIESGVDF
jgi:hypothetical protein